MSFACPIAFWDFWSSELALPIWVVLAVSLKEVSLVIIFLIVPISWVSIFWAACFCIARSLPDRCCEWIMFTLFIISSWTVWASAALLTLSNALCFCASTAFIWSVLVLSSSILSLLISSLTIAASPLINCLAYCFWSVKEIKLVTCFELIITMPFSQTVLILSALIEASILFFVFVTATSTAAICSTLTLLSSEESFLILFFTLEASKSIRSLASWHCWSKLALLDW